MGSILISARNKHFKKQAVTSAVKDFLENKQKKEKIPWTTEFTTVAHKGYACPHIPCNQTC